jgi:predicted Rossmann fold nucleotide-binding protein DprA/Smf involved in DNA uptake
MQPTPIQPGTPDYPAALLRNGVSRAPQVIHALGNLAMLRQPLMALFCSAKCPGHVILPAYDLAARWRDAGRAVISGFHSPVEKECLRILLRGSQPIIICPARSLPQRVPPDWRTPLADGRLLLLSCFPSGPRRATADTAHRRNEFVATLATEITVLHATPGGRLERLLGQLQPQAILPAGEPGLPARRESAE